MGSKPSTLRKLGYVFERQTENGGVFKKEGVTYLIKEINLAKISSGTAAELISEIEVLQTTNHPNIVSSNNSFKDEDTYYIVMDYWQGQSLAEKIKEQSENEEKFTDCQILNWIIQICLALKHIHKTGLLHKDLMPKKIFLTEFGTVRLGGFGNVGEKFTITQSTTNSNPSENAAISYLGPETLTEGDYNSKSDIWSVGCILHELCTLKLAFSAETTIKLIPKILGGPYPSLPEPHSLELCELLSDIFRKDPDIRPTASEILARPFVLSSLSKKSKETVKELQIILDKLRVMADGLERVHQGTTIGSLTGGVIGAVGGITSIVGLILTPFTLGASLVVTGVGIGVAVAGGATAGVSNITKMVNQSSDHKAVQSIIKEFDEKINNVVLWLQEISEGLEMLSRRCDTVNSEGSSLSKEDLAGLGVRAGRGLGGIAELVRLVQVMNIGKVAAQTARVVRVAEVVTGVLTGLFVAADIFFIAMDAKEIHNIRQAKAAVAKDETCSEVVPEADTIATEPISDKSALVCKTDNTATGPESDKSELGTKSVPQADKIRSEVMKFVQTIRETVEKLQKVLDELKGMISIIPSLEDEYQT